MNKKEFESKVPQKTRPTQVYENTRSRQALDVLCIWIEEHLNEPIGWQDLIDVSGLEFQSIQTLFYQHKCVTAMTWIRLRRQQQSAANDSRPAPLSIRRAININN